MTENLTPESPAERKRRRDREKIAAKRAALTPEERSARRREHDARYRELHRDQRVAYDRSRRALKRQS